MIFLIKTGFLFILTALTEIIGCFLPYLWLRHGYSAWLLIPASLSLSLFVWLLTLHPAVSGQIYASYGGIYIITAIAWLHIIDGIKIGPMEWLGTFFIFVGVIILIINWRQ